jgi:hypothetical protein
MEKTDKKSQAIALRKRAFSIRDIANKLDVSKSSVSLWCRNVVLSQKQLKKIKDNFIIKSAPGRLVGAMMNKNKKIDAMSKHRDDGIKTVGKLSDREILLVGTALYWAEGAKTMSRFLFVNSNPDMILVMMRFLQKVLKVPKNEITVGVQINSIHRYRIDKVLLFWSKLLDLPNSQFNKPYYVNVKAKKTYENMDNYYGTVRLRVKRSSGLQYKILGLMDGIIQNIK